ncbi:MAG: hypothetical protein HYX27_20280 [Acidobacteria bacterium]|nr:hypothetical protein [Acidobacteriota bacterium]
MALLMRVVGWRRFVQILRLEQGQDLIEYALLLALVVLATAWLLVSSGVVTMDIWVYGNDVLSKAQVAAQGDSSKPSSSASAMSVSSSSSSGNNGNNGGNGKGKGKGKSYGALKKAEP